MEVNGAFMPLLLYAQGNRPHYPLGRSGNLNLLEPSGPVHACTGIALPFTYWVGGWVSPTASLDQEKRRRRKREREEDIFLSLYRAS
jgi:hypothetical protein